MTQITNLEKFSNETILRFFELGAACDALFLNESEAWLNRYQFNGKWGDDASMGLFTNGSGDDLVVILRDGIVLKGFDHESPVSRHARSDAAVHPKMYKGLPQHLAAELRDPALGFEDVTFCYWRIEESGPFTSGVEASRNGATFLLSNIFTNADDYIEDARDYFERVDDPQIAAIRELYARLESS